MEQTDSFRMCNLLESPPRSGFVPLKGAGGPTHEYDMLVALPKSERPVEVSEARRMQANKTE